MTATTFSTGIQQKSLALPIAVGGAIAGTLDLTAAFLSLGRNMPRGIAAGLIGHAAAQSGAFPWILGILLHYCIAFSAAAVYCLASRRLTFMRDHFIVSGAFFGIGLFLVMYLIVMPLCAFHFKGPYPLQMLIQGLLMHMSHHRPAHRLESSQIVLIREICRRLRAAARAAFPAPRGRFGSRGRASHS